MSRGNLTIRRSDALHGETTVPGDKSISHRAVLFGAIAQGVSHVRDWLAAGDTEASLRSIQALGVHVERPKENELIIHGGKLRPADAPLNLANAGTGIRLLAGIMAGQSFESVLDGSKQLRRRPMKRIVTPLQMMQANINAVGGFAPLYIKPSVLHGITYKMPVASAQVKSAVLLAGLYAKGATAIVQPGPARDHTERMLQSAGADVVVDGDTIVITPNGALRPFDLTVPGDISSAAFLIVAALIVPGSDVTIKHVNLNPTRTGLLDVLQAMDADISITATGSEAGEPVGDIHVRHSVLKGVEIGGDVVVRMIDEFPILMVAALCAEGETIVRDAKELRVKETDRLAVMTSELTKMGADITETEDGFHITGPQVLVGTTVESHDDHRIAMSLAVAGLLADGETVIDEGECAGDSFPGFVDTLRYLGAQV
ncbi:MAG: 3-phosphoshikimate 1-carboxyvinyltransferase [Chloroflexi bacterium]|nr:MAG: 3-phosphoshikimate 1-carboxyvinyltransferase [Chloroflexota bacterium]